MAAFGDESNGGIKGVTSGIQLLAEKVLKIKYISNFHACNHKKQEYVYAFLFLCGD